MPEIQEPRGRKLNFDRTVQLNKDEQEQIAKEVRRAQVGKTQDLMRQQELLQKARTDGTPQQGQTSRKNRPSKPSGQTTLIIPKVTKEMVQVARQMMADGKTREEIEQAIAAMQQQMLAEEAKAAQNQPAAPPPPAPPATNHRGIRQIINRGSQKQAGPRRAAQQPEQPRPLQENKPTAPMPEKAPVKRREDGEEPTRMIPKQDIRAAAHQMAEARARQAEEARRAEKAAALPQKAKIDPEEELPEALKGVPHTGEEATRSVPQPHRIQKSPLRKSRAEADAELTESIRDDHVWLNNPVMMRGQFLAPIVVAASTGHYAIMLCAATILLLTATRLLAVLLNNITGGRGKALIYVYSAAILYIPTYIILYRIFGADLTALGIYLPMLAVEPAIIKRMEYDGWENFSQALHRGISNTIGICITTMLVGLLREAVGMGTLLGVPVLKAAWLPLVAQPAGGFMVVGVLAAGWTAVADAYITYKREEVRRFYDKRK